jgi:hypothetical protein
MLHRSHLKNENGSGCLSVENSFIEAFSADLCKTGCLCNRLQMKVFPSELSESTSAGH